MSEATTPTTRETASAPPEMRRDREVHAFDLPDEYANKLDDLSRSSASNMRKARTGAFAAIATGIVNRRRQSYEKSLGKLSEKSVSLDELTARREKIRSKDDKLRKFNRLFGHSHAAAEDINHEVYETLHDAIEKAQVEWIHERYMAADEADRKYDLLSPDEIDAHERAVAESYLEQYTNMLHSSVHGDNGTSEGVGKSWMEITGEFLYGKNKDRMTDAERKEYEEQEKNKPTWKKFGRVALRGAAVAAGALTVGTIAMGAGAALAPAAVIAGGATMGAKYFFKAQRDRGGIKWKGYDSPDALRTAVGKKQAAIGEGTVTEEARRGEFNASQLNSREEFKELEAESKNRQALKDEIKDIDAEIEHLSSELDTLDNEWEDLTRESRETLEKIDQLKHDMETMLALDDHDTSALKAMSDQLASLEKAHDDLKARRNLVSLMRTAKENEIEFAQDDRDSASARLNAFEERINAIKGDGRPLERIGSASRTLIAGLALEKEAQKAEIKEAVQNKRTTVRVLGGVALGATISAVGAYVVVPGVGKAFESVGNWWSGIDTGYHPAAPRESVIPSDVDALQHLEKYGFEVPGNSEILTSGEGHVELTLPEGASGGTEMADGSRAIEFDMVSADQGGEYFGHGEGNGVLTDQEIYNQLEQAGVDTSMLPDTFDAQGNFVEAGSGETMTLASSETPLSGASEAQVDLGGVNGEMPYPFGETVDTTVEQGGEQLVLANMPSAEVDNLMEPLIGQYVENHGDVAGLVNGLSETDAIRMQQDLMNLNSVYPGLFYGDPNTVGAVIFNPYSSYSPTPEALSEVGKIFERFGSVSILPNQGALI